ncbi:MAG: RsmG family class I SAM-dependent methyltransferase [Myxococcota bacterium]
MLDDELGPWMERRRWALGADALARIETLLGLWLRYGAVMNLSSARTREELLVHVRDGLDTAWVVRQGLRQAPRAWVDFGSGGGFPGLVVAAVGEAPLALVEPRQKRVAFLELAVGSIEVKSVRVFRGRYERSTWEQNPVNRWIMDYKDARVVGSARAVWEPEGWISVARHVGGSESHVVMHLKTEEQARGFGALEVATGERGVVALVGPAGSSAGAEEAPKN